MRKTIIDSRYRVLKKIGAGATGDVYRVSDLKRNEILALKILSKRKTSPEIIQRFKREFILLAELRHPNLCQVYDFGMLKGGRSYFTMEYVDGKNIFNATKDLAHKKIYPLIVQLCRVLEYIHAKGLIHYDIKPSNVLVQMTDNKIDTAIVKLMDFGLAGEQRVKGGVVIKGTFPYIAPEVIKGLSIDHRADLYSLGVLLYEILTQRSLSAGVKGSLATLIKRGIDWQMKPPSRFVTDIPKVVDRLTLRLLAFEPAERYSRANELIKEINKITGRKFELETEKTLEGYLLSSRFVGRGREMNLLKSSYEKARQGKGKVVLITGAAGIGKSRFLKEFKIFAQLEHSPCFMGYAHRDKTQVLEPFYDIFSELINHLNGGYGLSKEVRFSLAVLFKMFPDLALGHLRKTLPKLVPLEPEQEKLRSFEALSELVKYLASSFGYMIILLEDLHWADHLSIQFLEYLGRNLEDKKILICGTARKEELTQNLVLQKAITNLSNGGYLQQIKFEPLNYKSLYSFLDSTITPASNSSALVQYFMQKTGGNPYFVEEIVRSLLKTGKVSVGKPIEITDVQKIAIPEKIGDIVLDRIKDLSIASAEVVKFTAVLLKEFSYDLMKRLTNLSDVELSKSLWELRRKQILIEEEGQYRFYHPTLHEAISQRLGVSEKNDLNYRIGTTLERIHRGSINKIVRDLAYYFINAKDRERGIKYGLKATKRCSERYAHEQAINFYKGVVEILDHRNTKLLFNVLRELAQVERSVGYYDEAIKHYNKAISLRPGEVDKKIEIYLGIGDVYLKMGQYKKALPIYRRGLRFLKKKKKGKLKTLIEIKFNTTICFIHFQLGDFKRAQKFNFYTLRFLDKDFKKREEIRLVISIYNAMGAIEICKGRRSKIDYETAICYFKRVYKYSKKIKDEEMFATVLYNLGICYHYKLDYQKAIDCYRRGILISEKIRDQYRLAIGLLNLGITLRNEGFYPNALDCFQKTLCISRKIGSQFIAGGSLLGLGACFLELCNYKEAKEYSVKALKVFDTMGWKGESGALIKNIGFVYAAVGDYTMSLRFFRSALKIFRNIKDQRQIAGLFISISLVLIEIGEFSRAKRYIEDALKIASVIEAKDLKIDCYIFLSRIYILTKNCVIAHEYYNKATRIVEVLEKKSQLLQFFLLVSEIYYLEKKYLKGVKVINKAIKLAKKMGTKDLYVNALLIKAKHEMELGTLPKLEVFKILDETERIAKEIGCPEVLWKVYFEYGKFLQDNKQYLKALDYYDKCNNIFRDVSGKIKNELHRKSYLNRPDRQVVDTAIKEIERLND